MLIIRGILTAAAMVTVGQSASAMTLPAFSKLDQNRDGIVILEEVRGWMASLHKAMDRDRDGLLTIQEIISGGFDPETAETIRSNNDLDGSGDLSLDELTVLLPVLFEMADANRDSLLEPAEYQMASDRLRGAR